MCRKYLVNIHVWKISNPFSTMQVFCISLLSVSSALFCLRAILAFIHLYLYLTSCFHLTFFHVIFFFCIWLCTAFSERTFCTQYLSRLVSWALPLKGLGLAAPAHGICGSLTLLSENLEGVTFRPKSRKSYPIPLYMSHLFNSYLLFWKCILKILFYLIASSK